MYLRCRGVRGWPFTSLSWRMVFALCFERQDLQEWQLGPHFFRMLIISLKPLENIFIIISLWYPDFSPTTSVVPSHAYVIFSGIERSSDVCNVLLLSFFSLVFRNPEGLGRRKRNLLHYRETLEIKINHLRFHDGTIN